MSGPLPAIFHQAHALARKGVTELLSESEAKLVLYGLAPIVFKAVHGSATHVELARCLEEDGVVFSVVVPTCQEAAAIFSSVLEQTLYTRFRMGCRDVEKCPAAISEMVAEADKPDGCFFILVSLGDFAQTVFMYDYTEGRSFPLARDHASKCRLIACKVPAAGQRCGGCKSSSVRYCGKDHQQQDWRFHKRKCKKVLL